MAITKFKPSEPLILGVCFHKWSTQNGWFIRENLLLTWMIWGLPLFQENPIYVQRDWIFHTDCCKITSPDSVQVFRWLTLSISTTIPKKYCAFRGTGSIAFSWFLLKPPGCCPVLGFTFQPMWARLKNRNPLPLMDSFIFAWAKKSNLRKNLRIFNGCRSFNRSYHLVI